MTYNHVLDDRIGDSESTAGWRMKKKRLRTTLHPLPDLASLSFFQD